MKKILNKKPVVLLSIETKARELPGKVLLSCFLAEKGFRVILTNYRKISFVLKTGGWLYIDRNSFAPRMSFFSRLKFFGFKLVCLDEEGIVWRKSAQYKSRIHVKTNGYVDRYFTWGKKQTDLIKEVSESINTVITGNPRVDLLRPELTDIYKVRADVLNEKYGNYILFVSNFATNNSFYSRESEKPLVDFLVNEMKRHGLLNTVEDEEDYRQFFENRKRVFDKIVLLIKKISASFPDTNIIIRPHPSENHDTWRELMKDCSNVHVLFQGELTPWIIAAKAVIHNSCTTGVEAALLKLKAIAYVPVDEPDFECGLPNMVSAAVSTEEEVIELIKQAPLLQDVPPILEEYISSLTGPFACEKIADEIENLYRNRKIKEIIKRKIHFKYNLISRLLSVYLKRKHENSVLLTNRRGIKKSNHLKDYKKQKLEHISTDECNLLIDEYRKLLHRFSDLKADNVHGYIEIS